MLLSTQTDITANRLGYEKSIVLLAAAGYDALDFSFFAKPQRDGVFAGSDEDVLKFAAGIRSAADGVGIAFDQAHAPFSFLREQWDDWENTILPTTAKAIRASAVLGAKVVVVHPLQYVNYRRNTQRLVEESLKYYRMLRPVAEQAGVKIALENLWQRDINRDVICPSICADPKELSAMVDELGLDVFTVCLDLGHCGLTGWDAAECILALGHDRLGALHVHDNDHFSDAHTLPGFGKMNWKDICAALGKIDYAGNFTLEADGFFNSVVEDSLLPSAARFMADTGRALMAEVNRHRG